MRTARCTVLLTGFEPFDGEPVNPSARVVAALAADPAGVPGLELAAVVLPVDRLRMPVALARAVRLHAPDAVLALGQATGRARLQLETRAVNLLDFGGRTDNGGHHARGEPLHADGPQALHVPPDLAALADELAAAGWPIERSTDAGRHLCNALLYELLHRHVRHPAAFVHVPLLPEQAVRRGRGEPCLAEEVSLACVRDLLARLPARLSRPAEGLPRPSVS